MKINCFPSKISLKEAKEMAEKKGNFIGKILLKNHNDINMKEFYIENKIITYEVIFTPISLFKKFIKGLTEKKSSIRVIANGSTGGVAYYDEKGIQIDTKEVEKEKIQLSDYEMDRLVAKGNVLVRKILRRRIGGNLKIKVLNVETVFRPYHVAFFGDLIEGNKVRYIPIAADGCNVKRTF